LVKSGKPQVPRALRSKRGASVGSSISSRCIPACPQGQVFADRIQECFAILHIFALRVVFVSAESQLLTSLRRLGRAELLVSQAGSLCWKMSVRISVSEGSERLCYYLCLKPGSVCSSVNSLWLWTWWVVHQKHLYGWKSWRMTLERVLRGNEVASPCRTCHRVEKVVVI